MSFSLQGSQRGSKRLTQKADESKSYRRERELEVPRVVNSLLVAVAHKIRQIKCEKTKENGRS